MLSTHVCFHNPVKLFFWYYRRESSWEVLKLTLSNRKMKIKIEVTMINKIQHVQILFNSVKVILTDILVHYQISL